MQCVTFCHVVHTFDEARFVDLIADLDILMCTAMIALNWGLITKKILRLSYDVIITYDNRKLLSHSKIILRFFCN